MACLKKRGDTYYAQYYANGKQKRRCLHTDNYQIAKARLRNLEQTLQGADDSQLPTRTPLPAVLENFANHIRAHKRPKSAQTELCRLRFIFGTVTPALANSNAGGGPCSRHSAVRHIESTIFEQIATHDMSAFIQENARQHGWSGKTANDYRQLLVRLFNWAMDEGGVRIPGDRNPAVKITRYRENKSPITFLTLQQIEEQLAALAPYPQLQTMVAVYIYAGLRREEALWLQLDDVDTHAGVHGVLRIRAKTVNSVYWRPKTGIDRVVPISSALRCYLDRYTPCSSADNWLFPSPKGVWWNPDNFSHDLRQVQSAIGLDWSCLDYRHTFGSQLAQKGESLYKISHLMGNSPEICRKHYAALIPEALTDTVEFPQHGPETSPPAPEPVVCPTFRLLLPQDDNKQCRFVASS
ncbi:MAG: phage integrase family protein [Planctomycetes bacterium]|nr:phage integrase family protein [Planctomycetota bacterium]